MSSNDNKYSEAMEKMKGEPVPGFPGMTWGSMKLERPPMVRSQHADQPLEWKATRDRVSSIVSPPSSVATEDTTSAN